jgi:hypothetical protein
MNPARSAFLAAILFAAIAIPLSAVRPLWLDEILRLIETRRPSTVAMVDSLRQTPGAVPLGYIVQRAVLRIGGYSRVVERLQAALFGAGAVFIVAMLGTELGLRRGWQAAVIFAAFPMTLRYATESGVYSQALFFSLLATLLQVRLAKRPAVALAGLYWLALTAAVYTQPYSLCVGLAHLLWSCIRRAGREALLSGSALALADCLPSLVLVVSPRMALRRRDQRVSLFRLGENSAHAVPRIGGRRLLGLRIIADPVRDCPVQSCPASEASWERCSNSAPVADRDGDRRRVGRRCVV